MFNKKGMFIGGYIIALLIGLILGIVLAIVLACYANIDLAGMVCPAGAAVEAAAAA